MEIHLQRDAAVAERDRLRASDQEKKEWLDAIARALHSHHTEPRWTYLPDQLADMVTALRNAELQAAITISRLRDSREKLLDDLQSILHYSIGPELRKFVESAILRAEASK